MRNELLVRTGNKSPERKNKEKEDKHLSESEIIDKIQLLSTYKQTTKKKENKWIKLEFNHPGTWVNNYF